MLHHICQITYLRQEKITKQPTAAWPHNSGQPRSLPMDLQPRRHYLDYQNKPFANERLLKSASAPEYSTPRVQLRNAYHVLPARAVSAGEFPRGRYREYLTNDRQAYIPMNRSMQELFPVSDMPITGQQQGRASHRTV